MKIINSAEEVYKYKLSKWKLTEEARTTIFSIIMIAKMLDIKTTTKITDAHTLKKNSELDRDGKHHHRFRITFDYNDAVYAFDLLSSISDYNVEGARVVKDGVLIIESWEEYVDVTIDTMHKILTK